MGVGQVRSGNLYNITHEGLVEATGSMAREAWANQCWYIETIIRQCVLDTNCSIAHFGSCVHNKDLAFGGTYLGVFEKLGYAPNFVGVDLVDGPGVDLVCDLRGDLAPLRAKAKDGFDVVIATSLLEHEINPGEFVRLLAQQLRPNGLMILTCPGIHRTHGTVGVYGNYQNLLPDFIFYHGRAAGLQVLPQSFIYILDKEARFYSAAAVGHHETGDSSLVPVGYSDDDDFRNIPRIKDITANLRRERYGSLSRLLFGALARLSPTFSRIRTHNTVYFTSEMAVCLVKADSRR